MLKIMHQALIDRIWNFSPLNMLLNPEGMRHLLQVINCQITTLEQLIHQESEHGTQPFLHIVLTNSQ